jgi:hypothetical protein
MGVVGSMQAVRGGNFFCVLALEEEPGAEPPGPADAEPGPAAGAYPEAESPPDAVEAGWPLA